MKKALIVCHMASFLGFLGSDIQILLDLGYTVDIASNFNDTSTLKPEIQKLITEHTKCIDIPFSRFPFSPAVRKAYRMLKKVVEENHYTLIHCHTPVGGVLARFAARKSGAKVIYTAHGFHFFKGAPLKNWLLYYPVEKLCSRWTDVLITINTEDYALAKKKMKAKKTVYVPGVGIDLKRFHVGKTIDSAEKRAELGIDKDSIFLLSVGELIKRKNHMMVLQALHEHQQKQALGNIMYGICGKGEMEDTLKEAIVTYHLENVVKLLGYRKDIDEICQCADIFVFPSLQEGLPLALMEAMATGLPCVVSHIRGNADLIEQGKGGYLCDPKRPEEFIDAIEKLIDNSELRAEMGAVNQETIKHYDLASIHNEMLQLYSEKELMNIGGGASIQ